VTGPNDAKSALLPFLVTGDEGELRKQKKERGSSFGADLQLLLDTVGRKMQVRLQRLRQQMEAAAGSMRERMEESVERIAPGTISPLHSKNASTTRAASTVNNSQQQQKEDDDDQHHDHRAQHETERSKHGHPLIVFPGLPTMPYPSFKMYPFAGMVDHRLAFTVPPRWIFWMPTNTTWRVRILKILPLFQRPPKIWREIT